MRTASCPLLGGARPASALLLVREDRTATCHLIATAGGGGAARAGSARNVQDGVGALRGPGEHADRLCRGQDDQVDLAAAGLFLDLLHHRQRAISTGADHQPATSPGDVLGDRERSVPVRAAELLGRGLLALADLPAVDDQVVRDRKSRRRLAQNRMSTR